MTTFFDVVTLTCFAGVVIAFLKLTDHDVKTLIRLMPAAILFAIANQLGNHELSLLALILISAGIGYTIFVVRR